MRRSTIHNLPLNTVIEVKRRLRSGSFNQIDITSWLNSLGYSTTKSALNRYAIKLYNNDMAAGMDREIMAVKDADVVALFEELATLKARETEILTQIRMAMAP
jgi:hypothetical protein